MVKLQTAYRDNPKLGNAADIDKQLEENSQTMASLQQELQKYEVL